MNSQHQSSVVSSPVCAYSSFTVVNGHGLTTSTVVSTTPTFVPVLVERAESGNPTALVNLTPPTYPWSQPIPASRWQFSATTNDLDNVHNQSITNYAHDVYINEPHQQPPHALEWYEYEPSTHSYEFYDQENGNMMDTAPEPEPEPHNSISYDWDYLQEWAFDMTAEDETDYNYPSNRLQRMARDSFRSVRSQSIFVSGCPISVANVGIRERLTENRMKDENALPPADSRAASRNGNDVGRKENIEQSDGLNEEHGITVNVPDTLPPIPTCETLLLSPDTNDGNGATNTVPISYAAASTPRNAAETIAAYMNRLVKMHLMAANAPLIEPLPFRHRAPTISASDHGKGGDLGPSADSASVGTLQQLHGLDAMAAMARRNSLAMRQLNGGLLMVPCPQDEQRYCIGSSTAGRMLIGLEKLSSPRLYANDTRTMCLKTVPYTEDCDKVWCRLNLFRKQIGAEKTAARRNNVAIYELFVRFENFAYFGRLPYKWNLDEYLKSNHFITNVNNSEKEGLRILRGIMNGLAYVHRGDFRLFHGNLKPSNVLLSSDGSVFLTDYGFGRICCPMWNGAAAHRFCRDSESGTFDPLCWKAYEFFAGCGSLPMAAAQNTHASSTLARETPHRQADVFSAALLGYYAITAGHSHPLIDGDEAYRKTLHFYRQRVDRFADFVQLDDVSDPIARRLISSMLEVDVKQRPDARYVADHPAFWNEKKRNEFLLIVAEFVCTGEKTVPNGNFGTHAQSTALLRLLAAKKVSSLVFAQRPNLTPETVAKIAAGFGVKFEDATATLALKTFYRQHRRLPTNGADKNMWAGELEPLWNELAAEIYDVVFPSPPLKLKPFFTK